MAQPMVPALEPRVSYEQQCVKCVVVGDVGVGKTRLVCARACGTRYSLPQLLASSVSTVWAIDHYRKSREVLERSWCTVDDVRISLRLWDTFGYHDKDRRFGYGRADVILLCFSLVRPRTLRSVVQHWAPEIRRQCGDPPIVLCGCQADLRYMYKDPEFISIGKGPFFRAIHDSDIITPSEGRAAANEIGAFYYETSVLEEYGIEDVFLNVIRAALTHKRDKHFWSNMTGSYKHVQRPIPQAPLLPTKPRMPTVEVPEEHVLSDFYRALDEQTYCDVTFVVRGVCIQGHRVILACVHPVFKELFEGEGAGDGSGGGGVHAFTLQSSCTSGVGSSLGTSLESKTSKLSDGNQLNRYEHTFARQNLAYERSANSSFEQQPGTGSTNTLVSYSPAVRTHSSSGSGAYWPGNRLLHRLLETTALIENMELNYSFSSLSTNMSSMSDIISTLSDNVGSHVSSAGESRRVSSVRPAFVALHTQNCEDVYVDFSPANKVQQTVVTLTNEITPSAFQNILTLLYTGRFLNENQAADPDTLTAASLLGIGEVQEMYRNIGNSEPFLNAVLSGTLQERLLNSLGRLTLQNASLPDVLFCLDDGEVAAHKALLMARSEMINSMFSYNFRESSTKLVQFPGVSVAVFRALQRYLYTGKVGEVSSVAQGLEIIALGDRLCLEGLVAAGEQATVGELQRRQGAGQDVSEEVIAMLERAQLHNAEQLASYCLWYLCVNYTHTYRRHCKLLARLAPDNQIALSSNRWPPLWYLKELDVYERSVLDHVRARLPHSRVHMRTHSEEGASGCLGFCSRKNRRMKVVSAAEL